MRPGVVSGANTGNVYEHSRAPVVALSADSSPASLPMYRVLSYTTGELTTGAPTFAVQTDAPVAALKARSSPPTLTS